MHSGIVFLTILVVVRTMDVTYKKISFTKSGEACLNDCKNNKCFTDDNLIAKTCSPGNATAPVFHTSLTQEKPTCLSRCGKFGHNYEWCYVSNEKHWDYCSSETRTIWRKGQQTLYYGPCSDECKMDDNYKVYMCTNYHGSRYKCDPKTYNYVETNNMYGTKCVNTCENNNGYRHYLCYDIKQSLLKCAPPAKPPALREFFNVPVPKTFDCINTSKRKKRCNNIEEHRGNVSALAQKLEDQDYFQTVSLNEHRNPVYKYTVQASQNYQDPWLPLVLRAKITSNTIRCSNDNEAEGKTGFLIGHLIGGVEKPYNIVPLSAMADENLRKYEKDIYYWVSKEGSVQVTIVIMYKDTSNPFALGLNYIFVKDGKVCKERVDEVVYNNLPSGTESVWDRKTQVVVSTTEPTKWDDIFGFF